MYNKPLKCVNEYVITLEQQNKCLIRTTTIIIETQMKKMQAWKNKHIQKSPHQNDTPEDREWGDDIVVEGLCEWECGQPLRKGQAPLWIYTPLTMHKHHLEGVQCWEHIWLITI